MSLNENIEFKPAADGSFHAILPELLLVVSPVTAPDGVFRDTWTASINGMTVVRETDDLTHAKRSCSSFAARLHEVMQVAHEMNRETE